MRLVVHRDRDYLSDAPVTVFTTRLEQAGVGPLLTSLNDLESYFLNGEHIHSLNPAVSVPRIEELLIQATTETANKSVEAIVN